MALDEANHRLFVGCRRPAKVLVFDTTTSARQTGAFEIVGDTDDLFYDAASPLSRRSRSRQPEGGDSRVRGAL